MRLVDRLLEKNTKVEEVDFDKADLARTWELISKRIGTKPPATQAEMYYKLLSDMMDLAKDMPSGEQKIKGVLKQFKNEM